MLRKIEYYIDAENEGKTIEKYLLNKRYTKQSIVALKKMDQNVLINGTWEHMNSKLCKGDILTVNISENESSENIKPVNLSFDIVYEDEDIIVVNKPSNMPIHPSRNNDDNTLGNALAYYFEDRDEKFVFRCINRLDRDTTGLVIIAKHQVSAGILYTMMQNREIKREYIAIVRDEDLSLPDNGTVDAPIVRLSDTSIERTVGDGGERAVTHFEKIKSFDGISVIRLHLDTGRTHQIRVHMKHIGHPLAGDYLYDPEHNTSEEIVQDEFVSLIHRPALHSYRLEFIHPITGEKMEFEQKLPEDMCGLGF